MDALLIEGGRSFEVELKFPPLKMRPFPYCVYRS